MPSTTALCYQAERAMRRPCGPVDADAVSRVASLEEPMDKLIITVTCDSTMAYPSNPHNPTPKGYHEVAREYIRSLNAGASICHLHGPYTIDSQIQADGTKLSDLDIPGWVKLSTDITTEAEC